MRQLTELTDPERAEAVERFAILRRRVLDLNLQRHEFMAGSALSFADITAIALVDKLVIAKLDGKEVLPGLDRRYKSAQNRPTYLA